MRKKYAMAIGCIVTLLLLSSISIVLAKELRDFSFYNSNFGHDKDTDKRPQPQIPLMSFAHANSSSSPHLQNSYQNYHGSYGHWYTSALNAKGKESIQLNQTNNHTNNSCRMNFSNDGNTPVNITYNVSVSSNHRFSGCHGKLALGAGERREISENITVKKDWRNYSFKSEMKIDSDPNSDFNSKINGTRTSISFKVISWHSFSFSPVLNDSEEVDKDINE